MGNFHPQTNADLIRCLLVPSDNSRWSDGTDHPIFGCGPGQRMDLWKLHVQLPHPHHWSQLLYQHPLPVMHQPRSVPYDCKTQWDSQELTEAVLQKLVHLCCSVGPWGRPRFARPFQWHSQTRVGPTEDDLLKKLWRGQRHLVEDRLTYSLALLHSCINPVLYDFVGQKFRNNMSKLLQRKVW